MALPFSDLLRAFVTNFMLFLLLFTLAQPKYKKGFIILIFSGVMLLDILSNIYFYMREDYTTLAKVDALLLIGACIAVKPFFKETIMQWFFNCVTMINIYISVVIISLMLSGGLPDMYYNTLFRFLLFGAIILLFRRYMRPLYRQVLKYWNVFFFVVLGIAINFGYYVFVSDDIVKTIQEQFVPLSLLILLTVLVYISILYSLRNITSEYQLKEENIQMQNRQDILSFSVTSMQQRLRLTEELEQQSNVARHDRRHFNNMLLELLRHGKTDEAMTALLQQTEQSPPIAATFCENTAVNAAVAYYAAAAGLFHIRFVTDLDIPEKLTADSLELAIVISNLLENAVHACEMLPESETRTIRFTAVYTGSQLLLEIENPYNSEILTDENGRPVSKEEGHGIGTKSVVAFCEKQGAVIEYDINEKQFSVRLII